MKLPVSWLREWVTVDAPAEAIAEALTLRGFYVEGVEHHGRAYPGVVVARVLEVRKHPNADKLSLCRVDGGADELAIVCGAPNVRAGMMVPLATIGATLPGGVTIKRSKIRGEESQGMLCSARELELSDDHQGIVDLAVLRPGATLTPGAPLDGLMPPPEQVLEVEIPFNRPDGLGVVGLAREVKAAFGAAWTAAARECLAAPRSSPQRPETIVLDDPEGCPRYLAQIVDGVRIGPSPPWVARRLETIGQRALNNVVDATNLVLHELGQPLHAFDLARLAGPMIRVRRARAAERLVTLDGKERTLDPEVLVIGDRDRAVALAGIMGGLDSEVTDATTRILLECAWFDPRRVRRGARLLGLTTEASRRFERGVDPEIGAVAVARFLALLAELTPGASAGEGLQRDVMEPVSKKLALRPERWKRVLGVDISTEEAERHLLALDFGIEVERQRIGARRTPKTLQGHESWQEPLLVTVPSWRPDVTLEDDLVEEVGRAHGYSRIPEAPPDTGGTYAHRNPGESQRARARRAMLARGIGEAWTTSLVSEREALECAALLGGEAGALVRLTNPMSRESEVLRPNLLPGLLRACAHNLRQGAPAVRLFEVGVGFERAGPPGTLPRETPMLAALVTGPRYGHAHDASQGEVQWEDARGLWDAWLDEMGVDTPGWRTYSAAGWKPGASAELAADASRIAWAGILGQQLLNVWDIDVPAQQPVHVFVGLLEPLSRTSAGAARARVPGRFPPVRRDLAYFVPENVTHDHIAGALKGAGGEWLMSLELFDVYAGPGTPAGMKSLAFALQFQHPERTLGEAEVQAVQDRMTEAVAKECGGRLRER